MLTTEFRELSQALGYQFQDTTLLDSALRHRSVKGDNNERLEFVGDSIVNFVIAEALYRQFPNAREGKLSRLRANLVNGECLAELATQLDLGKYLRLGPGEMKSGGHRRRSILADAMEAVIAAIYFDAGLEKCQECILRWYADNLENASKRKVIKDAKTRLQEYLQAHRYNLPRYAIEAIQGDAHNQKFIVNCLVEGIEHTSQGEGTSRRRAEQDAAEKFLKHIEQHA